MNNKEFGCFKFLKLKYRTGDQIIQAIYRIGSHEEISSLLFNLRKLRKIKRSSAESCSTHWNLMIDEEFESLKFLELKYWRGDQIIQPFCKIASHQEIRSLLFNLRKFQKIEKSRGESWSTHWNLMNDEEFESVKYLEFKYRRGVQIIQPFCRIGSHEEIWSPVFNLRKLRKIERSSAESCSTHWNLMIDEEFESLKFLELKYWRGDQIIQPFCKIASHQEIRSLLFNLRKFQKIEKSRGESWSTHWNLMNDEEFESVKYLEFKYRRGVQIIQPFCRIGSHQEIWSPVFNLRKFQKIEKSTDESCRTNWNVMND